MPIITAIKPQKNQKRVNIYLDGKFGFGIDLENFVKSGLKVEQELTGEEIEEIVKNGEFQKSLDKLLKFATLRPRSEKEIKDWFRRKKVHESIQKRLFNRLKRLELIEDRKFAQWWVEQRLQFKFKSKRELIYELRMKGIDKKTIDGVLSETEIDEEKIARELLNAKKYRWRGFEEYEVWQKMSEFLTRKGFEWETVAKVVKEFMKRTEIDQLE